MKLTKAEADYLIRLILNDCTTGIWWEMIPAVPTDELIKKLENEVTI